MRQDYYIYSRRDVIVVDYVLDGHDFNTSRVWIDYQSYPFSAEQKNEQLFPSRLRIWSRETGSAVPSRRVSLHIIHARDESDWLVLSHGIPPAFHDDVHSFIPSTAIEPVRVYQVAQLHTDGIHRESAGTVSSPHGN